MILIGSFDPAGFGESVNPCVRGTYQLDLANGARDMGTFAILAATP
jgi:hypothetical protein